MSYSTITHEIADGVAVLTLNRPEKLNAWTPQMSEELADAMARANDDSEVGAIVLTGGIYGAGDAAAMGLVDRLVPAGTALDRAVEVAGEIASNPAPQLRMIKRLLSENGSNSDLDAVQRLESELIRECWRSPEHA